MMLKTHSMKLSVTALLVAGAFGFGTAAAADIINDTRTGQQTFSYGTSEVRGSTISNSSGTVTTVRPSSISPAGIPSLAAAMVFLRTATPP